MTPADKVKNISRSISSLWGSDPDMPMSLKQPGERLFFAVLHQALADLILPVTMARGTDTNYLDRHSARLYFESDMLELHAVLCCIEPEWIRRMVRNAGLLT